MRRRASAAVFALVLLLPAALAFHESSTRVDDREVTFDSHSGNEWWVQVDLNGNDADDVTAVEARDTGGEWVALDHRSWGDWTGSFHVEPGHEVRFAARFSDGTYVMSCWFSHPEGVPRCDDGGSGGGDGGSDGGYDATFHDASGNDWWLQIYVDSPRSLAGVEARVDCGEWRPLRLRDWGAWAESYHAPEDSLVHFRARADDGASDMSGGYRWTSATPTSASCGDGPAPPPEPSPDTFAFEHGGGNEWWVEVDVEPHPDEVQARDTGGAWKTLSFRDWGEWAGSFHIEPGHDVQFRARTDGSDWSLSCWFSHPAGVEDCAAADQWPTEGSYVKYRIDYGENTPDGHYHEETVLNATLTYTDGRWEARCEGYHSKRVGDELTQTQHDLHARLPPPRGPTGVEPGDVVDIETITFCRTAGSRDLTVGEETTYEAKKNGVPATMPAERGAYEPECNCQGAGGRWHTETGLVFYYHFAGRISWRTLELLDTDAPVAEGDHPKDEPPAPTWPQEGSFVEYEAATWRNGTYGSHWDYTTRFTYSDGAWSFRCTRTSESGDNADFTGEGVPPRGPLDIDGGDEVVMNGDGCAMPRLKNVAQGRFPEDTTRNGEPYRATVWWADEPDGTDDRDNWWDVDTGLLLRWEETEGTTRVVGRLTDTDAPLSIA